MALALDTFVLSWRKGHPWRRVAFNAVAPALSLWVAGHVFFLITGAAPLAANDARIGPLIPALFFLADDLFRAEFGPDGGGGRPGIAAFAVQDLVRPFPVALDRLLRGSVGRRSA